MKGLLLRVGIDQSYGEWNAPVDPDTKEFVYLPIPEDNDRFHPEHLVTYDSFRQPLLDFSQSRQTNISVDLPQWLHGRGCHLDPDFSELTYGDQGPTGGGNRGNRITELEEGGFIAFFSGMQPARSGRLSKCVLIGSFRKRAYRVTEELLDIWGGLSVKDGFIQRSANPPLFSNPELFLAWFQALNIELVKSNN